MITDIIEYNDTLIKDLERIGLPSFQIVLVIIGKKRIVFDSDQILSHKKVSDK